MNFSNVFDSKVLEQAVEASQATEPSKTPKGIILNSNKAASKISKFMRSKGFSRKGSLFYRIQNDIAFCVLFECTPSCVNCLYCIMPLFIPMDYVGIEFGGRMNCSAFCYVPSAEREVSSDELNHWTSRIFSAIEEELLPFYEEISSPEKLLSYVRRHYHRMMGYFNCREEIHLQKLEMYLCFYLSDREGFIRVAERYRKGIMNSPNTVHSLLQRRLNEVNKLEQIVMNDPVEIDAYCRDAIAFTVENCFLPKNRRTGGRFDRTGDGSLS